MGLQNTAVRISGYSSMKAYMIVFHNLLNINKTYTVRPLGNTLYFTTKILIIMLKTYTFRSWSDVL